MKLLSGLTWTDARAFLAGFLVAAVGVGDALAFGHQGFGSSWDLAFMVTGAGVMVGHSLFTLGTQVAAPAAVDPAALAQAVAAQLGPPPPPPPLPPPVGASA